MRNCLKIVLSALAFIPLLKGNPLEPTLCGDWINYKNEKCLKMLDTDEPKTQEDAENACRSLPTSKSFARLVTIKTSEQQEFVHQFLYENEISESVWLGLKVNNNSRKLEWNDGSDLVFNNSMKSNASDPHYQCVEMKEGGLWVAVNCTKKNIAVCEGEPSWPMATLHNRTSLTNPVERERKINQSEIDCEEKILNSERKTDLLKEATDKTMDLLKEAKEQLAHLEQRDESTSPAISRYRQRKAGISSVPFMESKLCGDWTPFKDEKCVKFVERAGSQTQEEAEVVCRSSAADLPSAPNLLTIKTTEEQKFVQRFLFVENRMVNNVWLGLTKRGSLFEWNDGSELAFNNWANQTVSNEQNECVHMESGDGALAAGLWVRVSCKRKNGVICERRPSWTLETLQNSFFNFKLQQGMKHKEWEQKFELPGKKFGEWEAKFEQSEKKTGEWEAKFEQSEKKIGQWEAKFEQSEKKTGEWETKFEQSEKKIGEWEAKFEQSEKKTGEWEAKFEQSEKKTGEWEAKFEQSEKKIGEWEAKFEQSEKRNEASRQEIKHLKNNPIPIGFIYVQLPNQPSPTTLWPTTTWMDVSSNYSGLFFRVVGGQAAPFGQVQDGNAPRLAEVKRGTEHKFESVPVPPDGKWSEFLYIGTVDSTNWRSLSFRLSTSEVRPRNQAIRILKRIK